MSQKLKSICDALDIGSWKTAIKLCGAFLQKQPGHALCKSLNAVALQRSGRNEEALQICDEVCASIGLPTAAAGAGAVDDTVLNTLQVVYRRCRAHHRIAAMYDAAWNQDQENEEMGVTLFFAAIRQGDFVKSQQVATKLYRKLNKPKYLHWVVVSMQQQVRAGGPTKVLDLAAMMLQKAPVPAVDENAPRPNGPSATVRSQQYLLLLHLDTLRQQGKYAQAIELLETFKGHLRLPQDVAGLRQQLLVESGDLAAAAREARAAVILRPDCWATAAQYIRLAFCLPAAEVADHGSRLRCQVAPEVPSLEDVERLGAEDEVWNSLLLFRHLLHRATSSSDGGRALELERVPRLAILELWRRAFSRNEAEARRKEPALPSGWATVVNSADLQHFIQSVGEYVSRLGSRNSCFFDLKPFLCVLEEATVRSLLESARAAGVAAGGKKAEGMAITVARVEHACRRPGSQDSLKAEAACARELLESWAAAKQAAQGGGDEGSQTEDQVLLALATLVELDRAGRAEKPEAGLEARPHALDAVAVAEAALAAWPECFHLRVLLVVLLGSLGLPGAMLKYYSGLDIKNIQHESLSYLAMDSVCRVGDADSIREVCRGINQIHEDFDRDCSEAITMAFQSGVYHRVQEYVAGMERMQGSALFGRAVVEEALRELGQAQAWDALAEGLPKKGALLDSFAQRPLGSWVLRNQDRTILSGLHTLPLCSPMSVARCTPRSWRGVGGTATPSNLLGATQRRSNNSAAMIWDWEDREVDMEVAHKSAEVGALEELLSRGVERTPALLQLSASVLAALGALLQKDGQDEKSLEKVLGIAREALAVADTSKAADSSLEAWRGGLLALEVALAVARCAASGQGWEGVEKQISELAALLCSSVEWAREGGAGPTGALALGRPGVPRLWAFVGVTSAVAVPAALWCTSTIPKTSGKKVKEGQEALHASRVALKALLTCLQAGLTDLQADLVAAFEGAAAAPAVALREVGGVVASPALVELRECSWSTMAEEHRKHLHALREEAACRLALLKSKGPFKP